MERQQPLASHPSPPPDERYLVKITTAVYALQAAGFLFGFSLIAALLINLIKREDVRGGWLESHFRWQIRTFWFTLLGLAVGSLTFLFVIGYFILLGTGIWLVYRIIKGWLYLAERRPLGP